MFNKSIPVIFLLGACSSTPAYQAKTPTDRYVLAIVTASLYERLPGQQAKPYANCIMQNATSSEISKISELGIGPASSDLMASIVRRPQTTQCIARIARPSTQPTVSYSDIVTTLGAISSVAAAYNSGQVTQQQQASQDRQRVAIEQARQGEITIQQRERDQAAFDQRQQEQRLQMEREMQMDIARRAEERRQLESYRQTLPRSSNPGSGLQYCRSSEIACPANDSACIARLESMPRCRE